MIQLISQKQQVNKQRAVRQVSLTLTKEQKRRFRRQTRLRLRLAKKANNSSQLNEPNEQKQTILKQLPPLQSNTSAPQTPFQTAVFILFEQNKFVKTDILRQKLNGFFTEFNGHSIFLINGAERNVNRFVCKFSYPGFVLSQYGSGKEYGEFGEWKGDQNGAQAVEWAKRVLELYK
ncbi:Hypothetical_protein [Hexamita inflata]|uniref:Hypothetical_protein n=1 Tax=Hexamita inflata TaxID=28002 RepID=A0AA86UK08_9EUKA|nr:Hypothetical protein HINF_LOCUS37348 [Hexamita inflata]CAI9954341.1 Hypothetical protein HINF_LOCUS41986 [Hexamita inflata]